MLKRLRKLFRRKKHRVEFMNRPLLKDKATDYEFGKAVMEARTQQAIKEFEQFTPREGTVLDLYRKKVSKQQQLLL